MTQKPDIDDLTAGNAFRKTLVLRADTTLGGAPMWFGWAIMDAFLAGAKYGRSTPKPIDDGAVERDFEARFEIAKKVFWEPRKNISWWGHKNFENDLRFALRAALQASGAKT